MARCQRRPTLPSNGRPQAEASPVIEQNRAASQASDTPEPMSFRVVDSLVVVIATDWANTLVRCQKLAGKRKTLAGSFA